MQVTTEAYCSFLQCGQTVGPEASLQCCACPQDPRRHVANDTCTGTYKSGKDARLGHHQSYVEAQSRNEHACGTNQRISFIVYLPQSSCCFCPSNDTQNSRPNGDASKYQAGDKAKDAVEYSKTILWGKKMVLAYTFSYKGIFKGT